VEGVETLAHEEFVTTEGGDIGQGYFYGKPMPCDEFEFYLTNQSPTPNNPRQIEL
jgi:sensor c-di-GMP phosphodiesterase-like protein